MNIDNRITDPDRFYDELSAAHAVLDEDASADFNARLALVMANQIGDVDILSQCIAMAAQDH